MCDILNVDANVLLGWENNQNLSLSLKEQETIYQTKRYIDTLPNIASAGIDDYLFDDIPFEKIEVDTNYQTDFAIGVDGECYIKEYGKID